MNREEKIMKRVKEHYDYLEKEGYEIVFLSLQGSQNYNLDVYDNYYKSDIDTKAVVLPSFKDFVYDKKPISKTLILENNEHIDVKDIRIMFELFKKENISYIELLYTKFKIINPEYKNLIQKLFDNRDDIVNINKNQFLRCISGMSMEKKKALCHPYPNLIEKIEKYGFDGKQLSHCMRLNEFIIRYTSGEKIKDCYISNIKDILINVKKNLNINGKGYMDVELAKKLCDFYDSSTKQIKDMYLTKKDIINQKGIDILNEIKYNILSYKFIKDIKD